MKINLEPFLVETLQTLYYSTFNSQRFIEHMRRERKGWGGGGGGGGGGQGGARPPNNFGGGKQTLCHPLPIIHPHFPLMPM